jgi:uncharacterized membrane protein YvbJ
MQCPNCGVDNPDTVQFCTRCHETLLWKCPKCWHQQRHGGTCERCGLNFAAYWQLALARETSQEQRVQLDRLKGRASMLTQILLAPFTGGRSLIGFLFSLFRRS